MMSDPIDPHDVENNKVVEIYLRFSKIQNLIPLAEKSMKENPRRHIIKVGTKYISKKCNIKKEIKEIINSWLKSGDILRINGELELKKETANKVDQKCGLSYAKFIADAKSKDLKVIEKQFSKNTFKYAFSSFIIKKLIENNILNGYLKEEKNKYVLTKTYIEYNTKNVIGLLIKKGFIKKEGNRYVFRKKNVCSSIKKRQIEWFKKKESRKRIG